MKLIYFIAVLVIFLCTTDVEGTKLVHYKADRKPVKIDYTTEWWQTALIYQIYPRSFKDSNNDGSGDLQGIIQSLDHFTDMGVDAIWLSPIYKSPQVDNGYDISDYRDIDELYGTLEDLRQLIGEAHKRNIKVILDYVPNHTSDKHVWFQSSLKGIAPYNDYYIWRNASYVDGQRKPPNNWLSSFKGSAWEWSDKRQQYYYHQFAIAQPDLNYRNPAVVKEMKDVLLYWLNFGVDGFRMDAVPTLFEDILLRDEPPSAAEGLDPDDPSTLIHIYTINQNETYDMIYQFRELLDDFNKKNRSYTRIMMTEVYSDVSATMKYYVNEGFSRYGAHFTFNFITFIVNTKKEFTGRNLVDNIEEWQFNLPEGCTSNWVLGNHDQSRVATRLGVENIDALNMLTAILRGVQITYQGEEIGQENGEVTCQQGYDPQAIKNCTTFNETSRDFERTPFQWNSSPNAGFTQANSTWLPVSQKYLTTNLAAQKVSGLNSHYNVFKTVSKARKDFRASIKFDEMSWGGDEQFFFIRRVTDTADYAVMYNVDASESVIPKVTIENTTFEVLATGPNSLYNIGDIFNDSLPLRPKEVVFLKKHC